MSTTRARSRAEPVPSPTEASAPTHTAKLVRGQIYHLASRPGAWPDRIFTNGQTVAVSQEVFDHLGERAVDVVTVREPGQTAQQSVRKFRLEGPDGVLAKVASEVVTAHGGGEEVEDPYQ